MSKTMLVTALASAFGCAAQPALTDSVASSLEVPIGAPPFRDGVYVPINDMPIASSNGAVVTTNGNVALSSVGTSFGNVTVDGNGALTGFSADIRLHTALTLDIAASVGGDFTSTIDLPPMPLPPLEISPTIIVTPVAFVTFAVEGTAAGVAHASVVMPAETGVSFKLVEGKPVVQLLDTPRFKPLVGGPDVASAADVDLQVSAIVGVAFLTTVDGFPIGGPSVQSKLGVEIAVATAASPWWTATAAAALQGGWSFDGTGSVTNVVDLVRPLEWPLGSAPGALPVTGNSTRWSRVYESGTSAPAVGVAPHGGKLVVEAARFGTPYTADLDGLGNPSWETVGNSTVDGTDLPTAMVRAPSGDITVAAIVSGAAMRLDRFDAGGNALWARMMTRPTPTSLVGGWNAIASTDNGGVIVGGTVTDAGKTDLVFAQVDKTGNTVWITEVDVGPNATNPSVAAITRESSGNFLAVGTVAYGDKPNDPTATIDRNNALIVRLDPTGQLLATRAVGGIGGEGANRVAASTDGSYAIGGEVPTGGLGAQSHGAWLAMFSADDTLTSSMTYAGENEDLGEGNISGLVPAPGGGLLVSGNMGFDHNAWMMRVDDAGMPVWFKSLRGTGADTLNGIAALPDGLVAFGSTSSVGSPSFGLWLVRTNVDGMVDFDGTGGFSAVNDVVGWESTIGFVSVPLAAIATTPAIATVAATLTPVATTSTVDTLTH